MKPEQSIERHLYRKVKEAGGLCIKLTGQNGIPDRLVILNGRLLFIELKAPGGRLSPIQVVTQRRLLRLGQEVLTLWTHEQVDSLWNYINIKRY